MKLLLGNPGMPDGAITPEQVMDIDQDFQKRYQKLDQYQ